MPIPRRAALLLAPALILPRAAGAMPASVAFRVMREGRAVGSHRVTVTPLPDGVRASTELAIAVKLLGFTVYSYTHQGEEEWRGDRLVSMRARAVRQGTTTELALRAEAGALVTATGQRLPPNAAPLSWWREASMLHPLFDAVTGESLPEPARPLPGAGRRWAVAGNPGGEAVYAGPDGAWTGFTTTGEDGSSIVYEPN